MSAQAGTELSARAVLAALWLLHFLPLPLLSGLGRLLGRLLFVLAASRRRIALRNLELCFPEWPEAQRQRIAREHFGWLGASLLERGVLWHASAERLKRLIRIQGEVGWAEAHPEQAVMWLVPHFIALDAAGMATVLFQQRPAASIYQTQSQPRMDEAMRRGRLRFGDVKLFSRHESARPLVRAVREGRAFFNLPDMDFGLKDAAFVPFFGVPAATLLAPARMARTLGMVVQPVVAEALPGGRGWTIHYLPPWTDFPGADDDLAATTRLNAWLAEEIRLRPAQYHWVHRRFKTTPPGQPDRYTGRMPGPEGPASEDG